MTKSKFLLLFLFLLPTFIFSQEVAGTTTVKTKSGEVNVPGKWMQMTTADDSGQTYIKNSDGVVIAVALNPKKAYPFYKSNKSDFENVKLFYTWDADYYKENKFKTDKLKEDATQEYIIWKYNDNKLDNVFLFGSSKSNFINLLVYTNDWSEEAKIVFLENLYKLNK